jgi:anti-sigma factor RsiW
VSTEHRNTELMTRLLGPSGPEVSCEDCFELLDEYVELELAGEDADGRLAGMAEHLQGCPACHEDHESLRELVALEASRR